MSRMVTKTISLDDASNQALQELAQREGRSVDELLQTAVSAFLERRKYLAAIDEGLADAKAGRVIDGDRVDAWLESWGTDNELDPPT
jgi:predicted transcriptional regulator